MWLYDIRSRGATRLDGTGTRSKFGAPCSNLRSFGSKCTLLKKEYCCDILSSHSDSAPEELRSPCPLVTTLITSNIKSSVLTAVGSTSYNSIAR